MKRMLSGRELIWFAPFLCIMFVITSLLRSAPTAAPEAVGRVVADAAGSKVYLEEPFRGIVLTWGAWDVGWYLQSTHSPETVMNAGGPEARENFGERSLMSKVVPVVLQQDHYWNTPFGDEIQRAKWDIEMAYTVNAGVFLGNGGDFGMVPELRRAGLPAMLLSSNPVPPNWDGACYQVARVEAALVGHPELAEGQIARYKQAFADINAELQPEDLAHQQRVLMMGSSESDWRYFYFKSLGNSYQIYFAPAGILNASKGHVGESLDAERVLAMDPDIIFLTGSRDSPSPTEGPKEFLRDPRWRGLKAVREKRVYRVPGGGGLGGLMYQPIYDRWMAEVAYPDHMKPRVRQIMRDYFFTEFNYRLSDDQIDNILNVNENKDLPESKRFERDYQTKNTQETVK